MRTAKAVRIFAYYQISRSSWEITLTQSVATSTAIASVEFSVF